MLGQQIRSAKNIRYFQKTNPRHIGDIQKTHDFRMNENDQRYPRAGLVFQEFHLR